MFVHVFPFILISLLVMSIFLIKIVGRSIDVNVRVLVILPKKKNERKKKENKRKNFIRGDFDHVAGTCVT